MLLVAVVEMTPGREAEGQGYEDRVLRLLDHHDGTLERRMRGADGTTEVHVIRFGSRAGYESFLADPDRLELRASAGDAAPSTRVIEVSEL
jgi:hypothetical protein